MNKEAVQREIRGAILGELAFRLHGQVADINGVADVLSEAVMKRLDILEKIERDARQADLNEFLQARKNGYPGLMDEYLEERDREKPPVIVTYNPA